MQAFSLSPNLQEIKSIDIEMKANTTYSFFNSILIDEITTLQKHLIFTDANALSEKKPAYFLGEQLLLGDTLIIGQNGLEESDVSIPLETLKELINYKVPAFYADVLSLLSTTDVNLYKTFTLSHNGENLALNTEWILYTFNIADNRTKEYFLAELSKVLEGNSNVNEYLQKMAGLALKAAK
jgi:predicted mannosyl-3-phosphoglycerate phosphatase (HAD superfamily)